MLSLELDGEFDEREEDALRRPSWRELVLAAGREAEIDDLPNVTEEDPDEWGVLLDCLEDRVLWGSDWAMEEQLDANPDDSEQVRQKMGIDDDYFIAVPPDPTDPQADRLLAELREQIAEAR